MGIRIVSPTCRERIGCLVTLPRILLVPTSLKNNNQEIIPTWFYISKGISSNLISSSPPSNFVTNKAHNTGKLLSQHSSNIFNRYFGAVSRNRDFGEIWAPLSQFSPPTAPNLKVNLTHNQGIRSHPSKWQGWQSREQGGKGPYPRYRTIGKEQRFCYSLNSPQARNQTQIPKSYPSAPK